MVLSRCSNIRVMYSVHVESFSSEVLCGMKSFDSVACADCRPPLTLSDVVHRSEYDRAHGCGLVRGLR